MSITIPMRALERLLLYKMNIHENFLREAIKESERSIRSGGYPVGAIMVKNGKIIARGVSNSKKLHDATSHAEIDAIRKASKKIKNKFLKNCTLYTSLETCLMCFYASNWARIPKIVYACRKTMAPKNYYNTSLKVVDVRNKNYRKQKIVHLKKLEGEAKLIIDNYEKSS